MSLPELSPEVRARCQDMCDHAASAAFDAVWSVLSDELPAAGWHRDDARARDKAIEGIIALTARAEAAEAARDAKDDTLNEAAELLANFAGQVTATARDPSAANLALLPAGVADVRAFLTRLADQ